MALHADNSSAPLSIIVDGVTSPAPGDIQVVELATVAGGTSTVVGAGNPLPVIQSGAVPLGRGYTLQRGTINFATATTPNLVTPGAGQKVYLVSYVIVAAGATTIQWVSANATAVNLSGAMSLSGTGGIVAISTDPAMPLLWTNTNGDPLALSNGFAVQISGHYTYYIA